MPYFRGVTLSFSAPGEKYLDSQRRFFLEADPRSHKGRHIKTKRKTNFYHRLQRKVGEFF